MARYAKGRGKGAVAGNYTRRNGEDDDMTTTKGGEKYSAHHPTPSWATLKSWALHGHFGGYDGIGRTANRQRPPVIYELPTKRCAQL